MAYSDMIVNGIKNISQNTISHMTKALSLLQTDLATIDRATSEFTISTIIAFSIVAFIAGDLDTAGKHLHGLFKVLSVRGGLVSLRTCTYLQTKTCRSVLRYLVTNFLFFSDSILDRI
jgi:hypothetical protein